MAGVEATRAGGAGTTVAAVASPPGIGAVSLIRLSGPGAEAIVARAVGKVGSPWADRRAVWSRIQAAGGETIDDVLVTFFRGPRSYTGEDMVEIGCHGGLLVTRKVLERLLECGAVPADPGEFTQRAFLNGKLDLTQAEAVMDTISARSERALRAARAQMEGRLGNRTEALRARLLDVVCHLEAWIDFPEEDIDPESGEALAAEVEAIARATSELLETADQGRILREGVATVIYGEPNTGKSSLLNQLAGHDRAIVNERPGTTRDTIEEWVNVEGLVLRLTDTAGVRETGDEIEREGVLRSERALDNAELVIEVVDGSVPPRNRLAPARIGSRKHLLVINKADLGEDPAWQCQQGVRASCRTGLGIPLLRQAIAETLGFGPATHGTDSVAINARHRSCLQKSREALGRAAEMLRCGAAAEFTAVELREAMDQVGAVAGRVDVEEILDGIFSRFCIGK